MEQKGTCPIETGRLYLGRFTMNDVYAVYENWAKESCNDGKKEV